LNLGVAIVGEEIENFVERLGIVRGMPQRDADVADFGGLGGKEVGHRPAAEPAPLIHVGRKGRDKAVHLGLARAERRGQLFIDADVLHSQATKMRQVA